MQLIKTNWRWDYRADGRWGGGGWGWKEGRLRKVNYALGLIMTVWKKDTVCTERPYLRPLILVSVTQSNDGTAQGYRHQQHLKGRGDLDLYYCGWFWNQLAFWQLLCQSLTLQFGRVTYVLHHLFPPFLDLWSPRAILRRADMIACLYCHILAITGILSIRNQLKTLKIWKVLCGTNW